jgi:ammonia channel protein AmtB
MANVLSVLCLVTNQNAPTTASAAASAAAAAAAAAAGIAFFYGGMVQSKNVVSTIMQAFLPLAIIPVVWSTVGYASNSTTRTAAACLQAAALLSVFVVTADGCQKLQPVTLTALSHGILAAAAVAMGIIS